MGAERILTADTCERYSTNKGEEESASMAGLGQTRLTPHGNVLWGLLRLPALLATRPLLWAHSMLPTSDTEKSFSTPQ